MRTVDEIQKDLCWKAYKAYQLSIKESKDKAIRYHIIDTIVERIKRFMPDLCVYNHIYSISVYLNKDYNITDWYMVMDEIDPLIKLITKKECKTKDDPSMQSLDFTWDGFSIYIYYGNGKCERVKIGTKTRTVSEDIYEVRCL